MLIRPPFGELGEIGEYVARVGMENMRPVFVDQNTLIVVMVVSIAADMIPYIADQNALVGDARKSFREDAAGKAGADDQIVEHLLILPAQATSCAADSRQIRAWARSTRTALGLPPPVAAASAYAGSRRRGSGARFGGRDGCRVRRIATNVPVETKRPTNVAVRQ
jgi:hypothetical protein